MTRFLTAPADITPQRERLAAKTRTIPAAASVGLTVGSRLIHAVSQALMLALIVRLGGIGETAAFIWATALTAPLFMFANMSLRELISTETVHGYSFREYWHVRFISTGAALAVLPLIMLLVMQSENWPIIALVAAGKALDAMHDLILGGYHRYEQADRAAVSLITRSIGGCCGLAAALAVTASLFLSLAAMSIVQVLVLIAYDMPHVRQFRDAQASAGRSTTIAIVRIAFPLGVVACLSSLAFNVPRYVVSHHLDDLSLAAFGCCASFLQMFTLVGVAAQLALSPQIALRNTHSRRAMNTMLWSHVAGVACVGVVAVVVAHWCGSTILAAVYGKQYASFRPVLALLMVSGVFSAAKGFLATGLTTTRSTKSQTMFAAAQFTCSVIGCLWLVPRYGLVAAAWVVAASSALSFTLHAAWTIAAARESTRT